MNAGQFRSKPHTTADELAASVVLVAGVEPDEVARVVEQWMRERDFYTDVIESGGGWVITAHAHKGLAASVKYTPEVSIASAPGGTTVRVSTNRGDAAMKVRRTVAAVYTYGLGPAAGYAAFVGLRRDLLARLRSMDVGAGAGGSGSEDAPEIVEIVETSRSELEIGSDERVVDNSESDSAVTRSFKVTKRWRRSCTVSCEQSRVKSGGGEINLAKVVSLKKGIEKELGRQYSASTEEEETLEEEVTLAVPPRSSLRCIVQWKRITQIGCVCIRDDQGRTIDVPFEVSVGVTFNQRQLTAEPH
jgi:hypothetical protein